MSYLGCVCVVVRIQPQSDSQAYAQKPSGGSHIVCSLKKFSIGETETMAHNTAWIWISIKLFGIAKKLRGRETQERLEKLRGVCEGRSLLLASEVWLGRRGKESSGVGNGMKGAWVRRLCLWAVWVGCEWGGQSQSGEGRVSQGKWKMRLGARARRI